MSSMAAAGTLHSSAAAQATVTLTANEAQLMNLTGAYSTERPPRCRILIPGLAMGDTDGLCIQKGNSISIPADKQALKARVKEQLVAKGVDLTGVDLFSAELGVQKFRSGGGSALSRTITLGLNIPTPRGCEFLTAFTQGDGVVMPMISLANHSHVKVEAAKVSVIFQAGAGGRHAGADDRVRAAQYGEQAQLYNHSALAIIRDHTLGGGCEDPTAALQQISATYINEADAGERGPGAIMNPPCKRLRSVRIPPTKHEPRIHRTSKNTLNPSHGNLQAPNPTPPTPNSHTPLHQ
ncbi:hypothetical protein PLESTF_001235900 [Pleodorina starrii]|nr:hypothetical protein PLESTF_001235900 [Pleodorina starrii]